MTSVDMPTAANATPRRLPRILFGGVAVAVLTALAAGCSTTGTSDVEAREHNFSQRHPVLISEEPENFDLPVGMKGPALSPQIESAIRAYVNDYRADGTGAITIQVPTGSANEVAASTTGRAVHYALVRAGVSHGRIKVAPYAVGDRSKIAPLRVSYLRVKAVVPSCGVWPDGGETDYRNATYHDFGCAQMKNLAAMVANPADLLRPRPFGPPNGARRAQVLSAYSRGDETRSNIMLIESGL